jgi:hypothetical protein
VNASRHLNGIHVSADIAKSLAGLTNGYKVDMHDPVIRVPLFIDAPDADTAHRIAIALCKRESVGFKQTGATIQRF